MHDQAGAVLQRRGPQVRGKVTRAKLLDTAEQLFTKLGYEGTAMGDVAERAGVGVGTLYHHFADKRALLLELIERWSDRFAAQRRTDLDFAAFLGEKPREAIESWLRRAHARLRSRPSLYLLVLGLAGRDEEVRRRYQRVEQLAVERLAAMIEFGQRRGLMRAGLDAEAAAFLIHHGLDMAVAQLLLRQPQIPEAERVLKELADMICRYILEDQP
jgi:TetR/AcrR family transcriptional regulator, transcriptional repressor for nem operon